MGMIHLIAAFLANDAQLYQFIHKAQFQQAIERAVTLNESESLDSAAAQTLASSLIESGLNSPKYEDVLLCLYAALICDKDIDVNKLENLFRKQIPPLQHLILSHIEKLELHTSYPVLKEALSSMDLGVRLHACQILAHAGHKEGLGQLESLMYRLPSEIRYIFADLFAQIGSKEAHIHLKTLLEDKLWTNRVAAILAVADFKQDGLIHYLKASLSHTQPAEIEAAAYALGAFGDLGSVARLEGLLKHASDEVRLSASRALYTLSIQGSEKRILELAKEFNPYAINLLAQVTIPFKDLEFLFSRSDLSTRINVLPVLLKKKHPTGLLEAYSLLKNLPPLMPKYSPGHTLASFKIERKKEMAPYAMAFRQFYAQQVIEGMLGYPEELADPYLIKLFSYREWVPALTQGLLLRGDEKALQVLKQASETPGNPFLRAYAHLRLFEHKPGLYAKKNLIDYLKRVGQEDMVGFANEVKQEGRFAEWFLEPTPEEKSALFLHALATLCAHTDQSVTDLLVYLLKEGHKANRPLIAAFLMLSLR